MNIKLTIPTLGRLKKQITLHSIPKELWKQTYLVVQPHEYIEACDLYGDDVNILGLSEEVEGLAMTRKFIAQYFKGQHHFQFDDDLDFHRIIPLDNGKFDRPKPTDNEFIEFFELIEKKFNEGYIHCGLANSVNMPVVEPYNINARITMNVGYSDKFDPNMIQWGDNLDSKFAAEDFYANLQLLTQGHGNILFNHLRVSGSATNAEGGCETYRTIDSHNKSMIQLQKEFPRFVRLREKTTKTGPWKGQMKLAATIYWKKAYSSYVKNEPVPNVWEIPGI